jgi:hypothetical protein
VIHLYYVYDNLSQTSYTEGRGIRCSAQPQSAGLPIDFPIDELLYHLEWQNRLPTQFITLYQDFDEAMREGVRRREQTFDGVRIRQSVRIVHCACADDERLAICAALGLLV